MQHENMLRDLSGGQLGKLFASRSIYPTRIRAYFCSSDGGYFLYIKSRLGAKTFLLYSAGYVPMDGR